MRKRLSKNNPVTPQQCRAARALLDWTQEVLAANAGVSVAALRDFERAKRKPMPQNLKAIRTTLEGAGIEFLASNGLRKR